MAYSLPRRSDRNQRSHRGIAATIALRQRLRSHAVRWLRWPFIPATGHAVIVVVLCSLALSPPATAAQSSDLDLSEVLSAVVRISAEIPADARTAPFLGTARSGNGIVIDDDGLILTIGYLILEAMAVTVSDAEGAPVSADIIAYDYDTGFGLIRAQRSLGLAPIRLGDSAALQERMPVLIAASGGAAQTLGGFVVSRREFVGYWEYLLDSAVYTSPPHPNWAGSALIGPDGRLLGVGSLLVQNAVEGSRPLPGNMFVPINLLKPIFADLLVNGRSDAPDRPWLGMYSSEAGNQVAIIRVAPEGPAARAGLQAGDIVLSIKGKPVADMADMYRKLWDIGTAGVEVPVTVQRQDAVIDLTVRSASRYDYLRLDGTY